MSVDTKTPASDQAMAPMALLESINARMAVIKVDHPMWFADVEDIDPFFADRPQVEALLRTAPSDFAVGYISGIMAVRQQLAIATGREF
jgi:hypothetical protein